MRNSAGFLIFIFCIASVRGCRQKILEICVEDVNKEDIHPEESKNWTKEETCQDYYDHIDQCLRKRRNACDNEAFEALKAQVPAIKIGSIECELNGEYLQSCVWKGVFVPAEGWNGNCSCKLDNEIKGLSRMVCPDLYKGKSTSQPVSEPVVMSVDKPVDETDDPAQPRITLLQYAHQRPIYPFTNESSVPESISSGSAPHIVITWLSLLLVTISAFTYNIYFSKLKTFDISTGNIRKF